jgi:hypothetical protein
MWPFSNLVYLRCVANWRNTYYKMLIQSLGTLPYFSQDLCQAVYFVTAIANRYGHTPGATKIQA